MYEQMMPRDIKMGIRMYSLMKTVIMIENIIHSALLWGGEAKDNNTLDTGQKF